MSRRKKHPHHENHERWLVSYADFITLMFAFFVVMYASSHKDNKKMVQMAAAIHGAFQQLGAFTGSSRTPASRLPVVLPADAQNPELTRDVAQAVASLHPEGQALAGGVDVAQLRKELESALGEEIKKHEIVTDITPEGFVISLKEMGFFESGNAHLMSGATTKLTRIASILNSHGFEIRVEGHTDDRPIHTTQFKSNWELSTARATEVVLLLVNSNGFDARKISVAGYGEFRPLASNETPEGRQMNRRVDLVVVAQRATLPLAQPKQAGGQQGSASGH